MSNTATIVYTIQGFTGNSKFPVSSSRTIENSWEEKCSHQPCHVRAAGQHGPSRFGCARWGSWGSRGGGYCQWGEWWLAHQHLLEISSIRSRQWSGLCSSWWSCWRKQARQSKQWTTVIHISLLQRQKVSSIQEAFMVRVRRTVQQGCPRWLPSGSRCWVLHGRGVVPPQKGREEQPGYTQVLSTMTYQVHTGFDSIKCWPSCQRQPVLAIGM